MSPEALAITLYAGSMILLIIGCLVESRTRIKCQRNYSNLQDMHITLQKDHLKHLQGSKRVVNKYVSLVDAWNRILALATEGEIALHPKIAEIIKEETEGSIYELYHKEE